MKTKGLLFTTLIALSVFISGCTEEFPGYSDYLQSIIDTLGNSANAPHEVTPPCDVENNHINYVDYSNYFDFEDDNIGESSTPSSGFGAYKISASVPFFFSIDFYFPNKPYEGIYTTNFDGAFADSTVNIYCNNGGSLFQTADGQDIYVEVEGDKTIITFCNLEGNLAGFGSLLIEGKITSEL